MELYKIIIVALTSAILCVYLKNINSEFFILALICGGVLILTLSLNYISQTLSFITEIANKSGIDEGIISLVIKITLVAYLIEFTCNLIDDFGIKSLSEKVAFSGKILLLCMSTPIFNNIFEIVISFLK